MFGYFFAAVAAVIKFQEKTSINSRIILLINRIVVDLFDKLYYNIIKVFFKAYAGLDLPRDVF